MKIETVGVYREIMNQRHSTSAGAGVAKLGETCDSSMGLRRACEPGTECKLGWRGVSKCALKGN